MPSTLIIVEERASETNNGPREKSRGEGSAGIDSEGTNSKKKHKNWCFHKILNSWRKANPEAGTPVKPRREHRE